MVLTSLVPHPLLEEEEDVVLIVIVSTKLSSFLKYMMAYIHLWMTEQCQTAKGIGSLFCRRRRQNKILEGSWWSLGYRDMIAR